jgi:hypothetical protein
MKKIVGSVCFVMFSLLVALPAYSIEACFDPGTQFYDFNGESKLSIWGVAEASGNGLTADAQNSWHSELSVAMWYATILKAQEMGLQVVVAFDPVTYEIWYIARPRACTPSS